MDHSLVLIVAGCFSIAMATLSGNVILAELQKKLKVRRVSNDSTEVSPPPSGGQSQIPEKPQKPPSVSGKSRSVSEAKKSSISTNQIQGRSVWTNEQGSGGLPSNNSKPLPQGKVRMNTRSLPKSNYLLRTANLPPPPKNPPPVLGREKRTTHQPQTDTPVNPNTDSKAVSFQNQDRHERREDERMSRLEPVSTPNPADHTNGSRKPDKTNTAIASVEGTLCESSEGVNVKTESPEGGVNAEKPQWVNNNKSRRQGRVGVKALLKMFGREQTTAETKDGRNAANTSTALTSQGVTLDCPSGTVPPPLDLSPLGRSSSTSSEETDLTSSTEEQVSQTPLIRQMSISLKHNARFSVAKPTAQTRSSKPLHISSPSSFSSLPPAAVVKAVATGDSAEEEEDEYLTAYQNVLDENLMRFDKRTTVPAQRSPNTRSRKTSVGRKPKPLPRKHSGGSAPPTFSASSSDVDSPHSTGGSFSTPGGSFSTPGGSFSTPGGSFSTTGDVDSGGNFSPQVLVDTAYKSTSANDPEFEFPGKSDQSDGGFSLHPLVELESEIDQLVTISQLPSSLDGNDMQVKSYPTKKELGSTKSFNPVGESSLAIRRRNTPKEQKELRNGICSDGATQVDSDTDDEYITMNSVSHMTPLLSTPLPTVTEATPPQYHQPASPLVLHLSTPTFDPKETSYYLKIIASTLQRNGTPGGGDLNSPPRDPNFTNSPTTPRSEDEYIDMSGSVVESENGDTGMGQVSQSLPVHLMHKTHSETTNPARKSSNSLSSSQNLTIQPGPARRLKYSDITIQTVGTIPRPKVEHVAPTKYQSVQVGPFGASLAGASASLPQGIPHCRLRAGEVSLRST